MAEKILQTRILNKIDTLEAWNKSSLKIKQGEICLATVAASAGTGLEEPVVMAKIGTAEEKTFAELPWSFYAKASDVLAACKTEDGLTAFVNNVIANAGIASSSAMAELANRVTAVEGKFGAENVALEINAALANYTTTTDMNSAIATAKGEAVSHANDLNTAMNTRVLALEAIDHTHTFVESELNLIKAGDVAKWNAAEQNAKDYADGLDKAMDERVDALEAKFTGDDSVADQIADAVAAEATLRDNADKALQALIESNDADILALQGLVGEGSVSESIEKALMIEKDGSKVEKYALAADLTALTNGAVKANTDAIANLNGNAETEGSVDYKIAQKFATLIENPDDAMNSIQELVDWTTEHAEDALEMSNQVTTNKNAIATLNGDASTAGSVDKKIADAIAAENLSQYATDGELSALAGRVTTAEGEIDTLQADLNTETTGLKAKVAAAEDAIEAIEGRFGADTVALEINAAIEALAIGDYAKAADLTAEINRAKAAEEANAAAASAAQAAADKAQGEVDALEIKVGTIEQTLGLKANDADLHAIAKSGNVNDLVQTAGDVLVFDCGTSAV